MRKNNRKNDELRNIEIIKNFVKYPEGSVLIKVGETIVLCNATVEEKVPPFLKGQNKGWVTAEYSMLPRATDTRNKREVTQGKLLGRTMEIQRLISRALRSCIDLERLGERTIILDCDVIQADGGTRTASITGAYIALEMAINKLINDKILLRNPLISKIAAISVGKVDGKILLDLDYDEDFKADVDMNIIMNDKEEFVEIQGSGEESTFNMKELEKFIEIAKNGINQLFKL